MKQAHIDAAIEEARRGLAEGGIPIGAVLVKQGRIIGRGHNRRVQNGDPTAHGEIVCFRNAGPFKPKGTTLITTLAPCPMCAGASLITGLERVLILDRTNYSGYTQLLEQVGVVVEFAEDAAWIEEFKCWTQAHRALWAEDSDWQKVKKR